MLFVYSPLFLVECVMFSKDVYFYTFLYSILVLLFPKDQDVHALEERNTSPDIILSILSLRKQYLINVIHFLYLCFFSSKCVLTCTGVHVQRLIKMLVFS